MFSGQPSPAKARLARRELGLALAAGAAVALLARLLFAERLPGDGSGLINALDRARTAGAPFTIWYHLGYAWLASGLARLLPFVTPPGVLKLLSAGAAGAAVTLAYVTARRLGIGRRASALTVLLLATSPAFVEHATTIEVHTVQLCAGLFGLCLMARAAELRLRDLFVRSLVGGLCVAFAHQTGPLLFPGLVLASFWSNEERRPRASWPALGARFATSAGAFTLAIFAAREATLRLSPFPHLRAFSDFTSLTAQLAKGLSWDFAWDELLTALPVLLGLAAVGLFGLLAQKLEENFRHQRRAWLALVLVGVPYAFFLGFGERTDGGYFLGTAQGLVLLVGLVLDKAILDNGQASNTRLALPILVLALAGLIANPVLAGAWQMTPARTEAERLAVAHTADVKRFLPEGGTLFTLQYNELTLNGQFEGLSEVNHCGPFRAGIERGYTTDVLRLSVQKALLEACPAGGALLVDWTWDPSPGHFTKAWWPYVAAVRAGIGSDWNVEELSGEYGHFLRLTPKGR